MAVLISTVPEASERQSSGNANASAVPLHPKQQILLPIRTSACVRTVLTSMLHQRPVQMQAILKEHKFQKSIVPTNLPIILPASEVSITMEKLAGIEQGLHLKGNDITSALSYQRKMPSKLGKRERKKYLPRSLKV